MREPGDFSEDGSGLRFGPFLLDVARRQLFNGPAAVHLTPKAFELIHVLVAEAPRVVSKRELHERLWPGTFVSDASLTGLVKELRRALGDDRGGARVIRTVHRVGYACDLKIEAALDVDRTCHWLVVRGRRVELHEGENSVGRDPGSDVCLEFPSVSRRHARILIDRGGAAIEDLGSKNGTTAGDSAVRAATPLRDGDAIAFGTVTGVYRNSEAGMSTETRIRGASHQSETGRKQAVRARQFMVMVPEDQTATIEFLALPSTHDGAPVERIDTHISVVFLAGSRAWKLKRAVHFDYIDASSVDRRKAFCEGEVRLNRRTAASLYRGVVAITREADGALALGGSGTPVDWVVEMNRFSQDALFDRLAERAALPLALMPPLAASIAAFHGAAEPRRDHGGARGMRWVVDGNGSGLAEFAPDLFDAAAVGQLARVARIALDRAGPDLDARRDAGLVRQCHGDLHLRNIVLHDGTPVLFDGVEFNDEIACVDVLYDLAFLLMDLWHRGLPRHANSVWTHYLAESGEFRGLRLMPLFLSCRAAIRAKTSATALGMQTNPERTAELQSSAREYLEMARRLLEPPAPCLVAIGGLSGSGKSTLARALAPFIGPVPGAIGLRSDEVRKEMCGVPPLERLDVSGYTTEVSDRVYAMLARRAEAAVCEGSAAIVDAVFTEPSRRAAIEDRARKAGVPFIGLWLAGHADVLGQRIERRERGERDASDADAAVLRMQTRLDVGAMNWHTIDASAPVDSVLQQALARLRPHINDAAHPSRQAGFL